MKATDGLFAKAALINNRKRNVKNRLAQARRFESYTPYSASFLDRRYRQYWFMLIPSLLECSANER